MDNSLEIDIVRSADGGSGVGYHPDGRVAFVDGALPGERVIAEITKQQKRHLRARAVEIVDPSPGRVAPACATRVRGCGGCDLAHADIATQHEIKAAVARDALVRIGRVPAEVAAEVIGTAIQTPADGPYRYRTTVRAAIDARRAGYRRAGSHEVVVADECRVAHPAIEQLLADLRFGPDAGEEATIRVSAATGEQMVLVDGNPAAVDAPSEVEVVSRGELAQGRQVFITEHAAGRDWQISAGSFFQPGPAIADMLAATVTERAGDLHGATLVDAYAGVGLFAGSAGSTAADIIAIERAGSSTADARVNLADLPAQVVEADVDRWDAIPADVVIADPARSGLAAAGVKALTGCDAHTFVLVSCDTGSFGRDVGLLTAAGYSLDSVDLIDAFADTSHIEIVSTLRR